MKKSNKLLVLAVSGALTAATAVPAMALENEFHGMFQVQFDNSNFNGTNVADIYYKPEGAPKKPGTANFFEQRARLAYIAKANQNVKLMTKFELDYVYWGNSSYTARRNSGGAMGADSVNIETKNLYLDLTSTSLATNAKVGMQSVDDAFKGIFFSSDMAGILLNKDFGKGTAAVGFFRWNDTPDFGRGGILGKNARDMVMFDGKFKLNDATKIGAAYYFVNSDKVNLSFDPNSSKTDTFDGRSVEDLSVHTLGLNGETSFGPLTVDGFVLYQFGTNYGGNTTFDNTDPDNPVVIPNTAANNKHRSAWAANVGARMKVGKGTVRSEFLYVSGESNHARGTTNAFYTPPTTAAANGFAESGFWNNEMVILGRDKNAFTTDNAIVFDANNRDQGVYFGSIGYDHPCTDTISASVNAGFAAVAKANEIKKSSSNSNYLGTELNAEVNYKFAENVTFSTRAAYVILGDYFKGVAAGGVDPENPYDVKVLVNYSF